MRCVLLMLWGCAPQSQCLAWSPARSVLILNYVAHSGGFTIKFENYSFPEEQIPIFFKFPMSNKNEKVVIRFACQGHVFGSLSFEPLPIGLGILD